MKKLYTLLLVIAALLSAEKLYPQFASSVTQFPFVNGQTADGSPMCENGIIYDDGTWENGYGWSPNFGTGKWVMKFTPPSYPWTMNQFCIALTRYSENAPSTWTFDIEIWDTTGAGGSPGTLVHSIPNQTATGLPVWPSVQWFDFYVSGIPAFQNGSYYIGISYTPVGERYIGADESPTTPLRPGYGYIQAYGWSTVQNYFPLYRAMGIRVDSTVQVVLAHDYAVGPFLSMPTLFTQGQTYNIKARIRNLGSSNESGVPIKFFVDNSQAGSVTLSLNAGATDSVSFPWTAAGGSHTLRIWSELSTDFNRANDTVTATVFVLNGTPTPGGQLTACRYGLNLGIYDHQETLDSIQVTIPAWAFGILDVNVLIDTVFHTWDGDLDYTLSHSGTSVMIINRVGSSGDNFIGTHLDDSAATPIAGSSPPFTGNFKPSLPLAAFNNPTASPNGYWKLRIYDNASGDTGVLKAWCLEISYYKITGGIETIEVPNFYALGQNYPNPFNPSTKIEYYIPRYGNVKLMVYDITGREVAVLVNGYKNPGIYTVDFDASSLSSGMYFYKIQSGIFTSVKKMVLLK
jgi:hypothetical protein